MLRANFDERHPTLQRPRRFGGITDEIDVFDPQRWVREDVSATGYQSFQRASQEAVVEASSTGHRRTTDGAPKVFCD